MPHRLLLIAALALGPVAAAAETPAERLFGEHLAALAPGESIRYARTRESDAALGLGEDVVESVTVSRLPDGAVEVALAAEGAAPRRTAFGSGGGNPVLMMFLENTVRDVARATGGSPFYLRNRMKEGLRDALEPVDGVDGAEAWAMRPFEDDPNGARLGAFAGLELRFALSEAAPGALVDLEAQALSPAGETLYREEIRLDPAP